MLLCASPDIKGLFDLAMAILQAASPEESFIVTSSEDKVPQGNAPKTVIKSISSHTQTTKMV